jgi:prepilin-type N-terminal cleavage/methylation domain-containing protein
MNKRKVQISLQKQKGFTIVELLIVVVVIAILAAITIVSFNGVQRRAKETAIISNLNGVSKQIKLDQVSSVDGQYPATLSASNNGKGIITTDGYVYQYTVNNAASPPTFCITATYSKIDYMISESTSPIAGVCPGHAVGGVAKPIITNLAPNPNFEETATGWSGSRISNPSREVAGGAKENSAYLRSTVNDIGSFPRVGTAQLSASPNTVYTFSAWMRSSASVRASYAFYGGSASGTTVITPLVVSNNQWVRVSVTSISAPTGATTWKGYFGITDDSPTGTTFDIDGVMITSGTGTPAFADGTTAGWAWNGTPHNSTSSGPTP